MPSGTFTFESSDHARIHTYAWTDATAPRAVVQIAHGMGEHAARYDAFARALNAAGYLVYANDHRGHGQSMVGKVGYMGNDGWNRVVTDAGELTAHLQSLHPGLPLVLFGHSMGSMLAQQYLYRFGDRLALAVLSGSPGFNGGFSAWLSGVLARFERWRKGPDGDSPLMQRLLFGDANKAFDAPGASGFEWLSRDAAEVDRYVKDELCGFVLTAGSLADLFAGTRQAWDPDNVRRIPTSLPVLVVSGSADPVHREQAGLDKMIAAYRNAGLTVTTRIYPEGRHEMLNETNRAEVTADIIAWLDEHLAEPAPAEQVQLEGVEE